MKNITSNYLHSFCKSIMRFLAGVLLVFSTWKKDMLAHHT